MSEKRFKYTDVFSEDVMICRGIKDTENNYVYPFTEDSVYESAEKELIDLLNDLDGKNKALELIAEDKLYSRRELEKENKQLYKKLTEQQDFINLLFEELLDAQRQGYVVNFTHKNKPCSIIPKELGK